MLFLVFLVQLITEISAWQWDPEGEHPCTIQKYTQSQFAKTFGPTGLPSLYHSPIVIQRFHENEKFRQMSTKASLLQFFGPDFEVTLSSSNAYSEHRRTMSLRDYPETNRTTPDMLANTTWYLFGETYSKEWNSLLQHYELPNCSSCRQELVALSFGIGNCGSGVQWHVHGPGFSESLQGRKHWVLYPPEPRRLFDKDQSSLAWMEYVYPTLSREDRPVECTLEPGEAVYFPDEWYHATINLDNYTSFISTFTTEHSALDDEL